MGRTKSLKHLSATFRLTLLLIQYVVKTVCGKTTTRVVNYSRSVVVHSLQSTNWRRTFRLCQFLLFHRCSSFVLCFVFVWKKSLYTTRKCWNAEHSVRKKGDEWAGLYRWNYLPPPLERHNPLLNPLAGWEVVTTPACRAFYPPNFIWPFPRCAILVSANTHSWTVQAKTGA